MAFITHMKNTDMPIDSPRNLSGNSSASTTRDKAHRSLHNANEHRAEQPDGRGFDVADQRVVYAGNDKVQGSHDRETINNDGFTFKTIDEVQHAK